MSKSTVLRVMVGCFLLGIIVFEGYQITKSVHEVQILENDKENANKEAVAAKESYEIYKEELLQKIYARQEEEERENSSEIVMKIVNYNNSYQKADTLSEEFFSTFFNWDNSEEYHDRVTKLSDIIATEVKDDEKIFDKGIDSTGGDYIKTSGLKAFFEGATVYVSSTNGNTYLPVLVEVAYRSWYGDDEDKTISIHYYDVTIDQKNELITEINRVF